MNRWLLLRRLRAPAFLILFGVLALLNQWGVLGFRRSWPLFLILAGLLLLAERAALVGASPPAPFPAGSLYPSSSSGGPYRPATTPPPAPPAAPSGDAASSAPAEDASRGAWRP